MPEDSECTRLLHDFPDLAAVHHALRAVQRAPEAAITSVLRRCTDDLKALRQSMFSEPQHEAFGQSQTYPSTTLVQRDGNAYNVDFGTNDWEFEDFAEQGPLVGKLRKQGATYIIDFFMDQVRRLTRYAPFCFEPMSQEPLANYRAVWVKASSRDESAMELGEAIHYLVVKPNVYARIHLDKAWSGVHGLEQHLNSEMDIHVLKALTKEDVEGGVPASIERPDSGPPRLLLPKWVQYIPQAFVETATRGEAVERRERLSEQYIVNIEHWDGDVMLREPNTRSTWHIDARRNELRPRDEAAVEHLEHQFNHVLFKMERPMSEGR